MKIEIDGDILADADAFDRARARADRPVTATPAVHAVAPVAAVLDEEADGTPLRHELDAACLRLAAQELDISTLRLALAMVAREATYAADDDSAARGERLDDVRKIARGALA